jgi:hypothetical protein
MKFIALLWMFQMLLSYAYVSKYLSLCINLFTIWDLSAFEKQLLFYEISFQIQWIKHSLTRFYYYLKIIILYLAFYEHELISTLWENTVLQSSKKWEILILIWIVALHSFTGVWNFCCLTKALYMNINSIWHLERTPNSWERT